MIRPWREICVPLARCSLGAEPSPRARTARVGARRPRAPRPRSGFHSTRAATRWPETPLFSRTQCKHHQQNCAGEVPSPAPRARGLLSWGPAADPSLLRRSATFPRPLPARTERTAVPPAGDWARPQASRPRRGAGEGALDLVQAAPPPALRPWRGAQVQGSPSRTTPCCCRAPGGRVLGRRSLSGARLPPGLCPSRRRFRTGFGEWNRVPSSSRAAS